MTPPSIWYTADWHLGHAPIIGYSGRPWATVDEMNDGLIARHNELVGPGDTVWVLGDVALRKSALEHVGRLNGELILVAGNHDRCWGGHSRQARAANAVADYLAAGFSRVITSGVKQVHIIGGQLVTLSHLPYLDPADPDQRYASKRPVDSGLPLICGHVHEKWRVRGRQINVGVDANNWYPVPERQLAAEVRALGRARTPGLPRSTC